MIIIYTFDMLSTTHMQFCIRISAKLPKFNFELIAFTLHHLLIVYVLFILQYLGLNFTWFAGREFGMNRTQSNTISVKEDLYKFCNYI